MFYSRLIPHFFDLPARVLLSLVVRLTTEDPRRLTVSTGSAPRYQSVRRSPVFLGGKCRSGETEPSPVIVPNQSSDRRETSGLSRRKYYDHWNSFSTGEDTRRSIRCLLT